VRIAFHEWLQMFCDAWTAPGWHNKFLFSEIPAGVAMIPPPRVPVVNYSFGGLHECQ
jgi:hypothetical protein